MKATLEIIMFNLHTGLPHAPQVMALYFDGCETFELPDGATFAELAVRIGALAAFHERPVISVKLLFDTAYHPAFAGTVLISDQHA
jgi:hypothetical protein